MERIPPHNTEAEISVLGAVLLDSEVFYQVSEIIGPDDFYAEAHREIFQCMQDLHMKGSPIDLVTVCEDLSRRRSLEAVGGRAYIAQLTGAVPTSANAGEYAKIIREKSLLRKLIAASGEISGNCFSEKLGAAEILDGAEQTILDIAKTRQTRQYSHLRDVLKINLENIAEAQRNGGVIPGLSTGFADLDNKTTGLQKSDMIIVAARPSMGKTAFALNIAQNAALKSGATVAIFSLEMSKDQLSQRMLSMEARVDSRKLKVGDVSAEDWEDINRAVDKLSGANVIIDDTPGISVMEIRNKCRRMSAEKPLDLVVIDYLQMMTMGMSIENRQQEVSNISRSLKQLARELACPVIVLSQLSRLVEQRENHRPVLSDLRESGAIEQDADVVMFLYREDYYKKDPDVADTNICEVIIAKQRNGEIGSVKLAWLPKFTKFADLMRNEGPAF